MSAGPAALPQPFPVRPAPEVAHCRTRPSFLRMPKCVSKTDRVILGLVYDRSIGWGGLKNPWADLDLDPDPGATPTDKPPACVAVAGVTVDFFRERLEVLLKEESLRSRIIKGRTMYALNLPPEGDVSGKARCGTCGKEGTVVLDAEWRPIPHDFFWHVPKPCDGAMLYCMGIIAEATLRWDKGRRSGPGRPSGWPVVIPATIPLHVFMGGKRGYKRSQIIVALNKLQDPKLGFIGTNRGAKSNFSGKASVFWVIPENFRNGEPRPPRQVIQPANRRPPTKPTPIRLDRGAANPDFTMPEFEPDVEESPVEEPEGEETAQAEAPETPQPAARKQPTRPVEFLTVATAWCVGCRSWGPVEWLAEDNSDVAGAFFAGGSSPPGDEARSQSRAGPSAASKSRPIQELAAELRPLDEFLRSLRLRQNASPAMVREIWDALQGLPLDDLKGECLESDRTTLVERIRRAAQSQAAYIRAIALGLGKRAIADKKAAAVRAAEKRRQELEAMAAPAPWLANLENATFFLRRDDCTADMRAEIMAAFPELAK